MACDRRILRSPSGESPILDFLYGTAFKDEKTADLVYDALSAGFRGVDTAAQHERYREDLVGDGVRRAISEGVVKREDLYIQTKYTPPGGRDCTAVPYGPDAPLEDQIHASINTSLKNFTFPESQGQDESYLDALVLHVPLTTIEQTVQAWRVFEQYVPHKIRHLGISNCTLSTLRRLLDNVQVKPAFVQNRFYHTNDFDGRVRKFCRENAIIYQAFWILSANPKLLWSAEVGVVGHSLGIGPHAAFYGLVFALGGTVLLNGTTKRKHMVEDLEGLGVVRRFALDDPETWRGRLERFKTAIGELE